VPKEFCYLGQSAVGSGQSWGTEGADETKEASSLEQAGFALEKSKLVVRDLPRRIEQIGPK
jgi:hypothetical protein